MDNKSIYSFKSYKAVMSHYLFGKDNWGQLTKAAEALNCQKSYLSRVIKEEPHITPDHAYKLTRYWRLAQDERDFFLTLVDWERAADLEYRKFLEARLQEFRKKQESIQERTERKSFVIESFQTSYFSSWLFSALHFLTSIPKYQTLNSLSERLSVKKEILLYHLEQLKAQGFIEQNRDRWIYRSGEFHAPKNSPLVILHHQNWRQRAVLDAQNLGNQNIHYTAVQTLSEQDAQLVKEMLLNFIEQSSRIAGPSKPEEAVAITCDFFKVD